MFTVWLGWICEVRALLGPGVEEKKKNILKVKKKIARIDTFYTTHICSFHGCVRVVILVNVVAFVLWGKKGN